MMSRMRTRSGSRPGADSLGGGTGVRVGRGGRGRRPREGNDERVDDLNGQRNDQGIEFNGGVEGVSGNVEGANKGAPDFSMIIAQQLQNLLPAMLAQVGNQGNVGNQNSNVVNENIRNVLVNGNRVGCSYKEFLACNLKEYDDTMHCVLSRNLAFCLGKTLPISKPGCVLCQDFVALSRRLPAFCLKTSAFCLKTKLRFASRPSAFCIKTHCISSTEGCVLSPSSLCFVYT
uniref:Reverse transcriptase domain-containing protein n=1 Tax=Tanacetum cinerariifolium TaxID=118510 RepID=A0A6L2MM22_TANCI|nr:hypothetical protein [Tanacetum cinerariifolium]